MRSTNLIEKRFDGFSQLMRLSDSKEKACLTVDITASFMYAPIEESVGQNTGNMSRPCTAHEGTEYSANDCKNNTLQGAITTLHFCYREDEMTLDQEANDFLERPSSWHRFVLLLLAWV